MQVFEQKNKQKVYIVKGVFFPFWGIHPMVILWFRSYSALKFFRRESCNALK